jgi:hypothetical protein
MDPHQMLACQIAAGDIVKPWLMVGPIYQDLSATVQGLTLFESPGAVVGQTAMAEIVQEAQPILLSQPCEGDEAVFRSYRGRWALVRGPQQYLSWGRYNISNHLGAAFLSSVLTPTQAGQGAWRLVLGLTERALVAINGPVVFDSAEHSVEAANGIFEHRFTAPLAASENIVTVALFRLARMAQVGFRLEMLDGPVDAHVTLGASLPRAGREHVEAELASIRLARDIFYPQHTIGFNLGVAPGEVPLTVRLLSDDGELLCQTQPAAAGPVTLCPGSELPDGRYQIACEWGDGGQPLTATAFTVYKLTPATDLPGHENLAARKRRVLEHYAGFHRAEARPDIWREVARYARARDGLSRYADVDEGVIADTCAFIAARKDCADFVIQGILRLLAWEQTGARLSARINALMKDTVLGFKYWVDEPGDTVMYMGSENHRFLFHVAEWLAGKLFPTEEFTNSRMRGLYHSTKGLMYITEWFRQRGRFGFDEWHSNSYYPVNISPLMNVYDFASHEGEQKVRQMAGAILDYVFFNLAADSFEGIFGTTHGRSYGINLKYPDLEGTSPSCWLLYGTGSLSWGSDGMAPVAMATSEYHLPKILSDIATDKVAVVESKVRQGVLKGTARHADFVVYRTPDYMMSAVQDLRKGEFESSSHVAQVTLGNKTTVFWSCPHTCGEGSGLRPDYWSGHTTLPRVIQYRNVMSLSWRLNWRAWMSHCFFEPAHFDEVRQAGNWVFGRVGNGFIGIYSQNGLAWGDFGQYAGREIVCTAAENTWLVECGRAADWGTFDAFVTALQGASIVAQDGALVYDSPSVGRFVTGWDVAPTVNGERIPLHGYPLVDSPLAHAAFGSGEMLIRHGDDEYDLWFNQ